MYIWFIGELRIIAYGLYDVDMNSHNDINNRMATLKFQWCDIANKYMKVNYHDVGEINIEV